MTLFTAKFRRLAFGGEGDLAADVPAEEVTYPLAFAQAMDHRVESTLQLAEFGGVEHHQIASQVALLHAHERRAHHAHWCCCHPGKHPHQNERFFAVVIDEIDRHRGLVNKFQGDASLAIFGAPNHLDRPEDQALAAARAIAKRLAKEVPECPAGIGVASGQVVAGNVGANERFEYTVIGEPVNQAARLCELAKSHPGQLLATADTVRGATEHERSLWSLGEVVTLRGHDQHTQLASPVQAG